MSHLAQARPPGSWTPPVGSIPSAEATAGSIAGVYEKGETMAGGRLKGVPDTYATGTGTVGHGTSARNIVSDSSTFASSVSGAQQGEPHPGRGRLGPGEAMGARLTVSPSMKMPTESPVPTQGAGATVPSSGSRMGSFSAGMSEIRAQ